MSVPGVSDADPYSILSQEEERELFAIARGESTEAAQAKDRLARSQYRWCKTICGRFIQKYPYVFQDIEEAMSSALVCLAKCLNGFDPDLGFRLSTYVGRAVESHLRREVAMWCGRPKLITSGGNDQTDRGWWEDGLACYLEPESRGAVLDRPRKLRDLLADLGANERNSRIAAEHLVGGRTLRELSEEHGVSKQRFEQIAKKESRRLGRAIPDSVEPGCREAWLLDRMRKAGQR